MAIPDERLVLEASVVDDFSDTLNELSANLAEIDRLASSTVENIEADVDIDEALRDLGTLDAAIGAIDDDISVGASVSAGTAMASGGGATASADGGGGATGFLSASEIRRAQDELGRAFTPRRIFQDGGIQRVADLVDGDIADFINTDEATSRILDGDLDPDIFDDLAGLDTDAAFKALRTLQDEGLTQFPTDIADEFRDLELTMGDFYRVFAAVIPLLGVFIGALPAAVGGLVALGSAAVAAAGALAGVAGLALLGASLDGSGEIDTSQLADRLNEFIDTAIDELGPLAQQLAPLTEQMFRTLEGVVAGIADRGNAVLSLTDEFRGMLSYIEATVPPMLADIVRFGEAAMPLVSGIIREMGNMDVLESFANILIEVMPFLAVLGAEIAEMLGPIFQLSMGFIGFASALTRVASVVFNVLDALGPMLPMLGALASATLILISITSLYSLVASGATAVVLRYAAALAGSLLTSIYGAAKGFYYLIAAQVGSTVAMGALTAATLAFLSVLTFGIAPALASISTGFTDLTGDIDEATSALQAFNGESSRVGGVGLGGESGPSVGSGGGYTDAGSMTVVAPDKQTGNAVANSLSFGNSGSQMDSNVADRIHTQ